MAVADVFNGDMIQHVFKNVNNESVLDLPVHFDKVSNKRYVLWSDLQRTFIGIDHIAVTDEPTSSGRLFFMVDENYQVYGSYLKGFMIFCYLRCLIVVI